MNYLSPETVKSQVNVEKVSTVTYTYSRQLNVEVRVTYIGQSLLVSSRISVTCERREYLKRCMRPETDDV